MTANELMGFNPERFTFVSLGGGALITYLSGGKMPGPEAPMKN